MKVHDPRFTVDDLKTGTISFTVDREQFSQARWFCDSFYDKAIDLTAKEYRRRRSLDSNAFAWMLMDQLAEKLGISKLEIYRNYVKEIGGNCSLVCVQNDGVEPLVKKWQSHGLGWIADTFSSKLDGCTNVLLYYGSSEYDSGQMSRLIDLIVADCEENGIDARTPEERARMLEEWG